MDGVCRWGRRCGYVSDEPLVEGFLRSTFPLALGEAVAVLRGAERVAGERVASQLHHYIAGTSSCREKAALLAVALAVWALDALVKGWECGRALSLLSALKGLLGAPGVRRVLETVYGGELWEAIMEAVGLVEGSCPANPRFTRG